MKSVTIVELIRTFAAVKRAALAAPVSVTAHGKPTLVIMSTDLFDRLRNRVDLPEDLARILPQTKSSHLAEQNTTD